LEALILFSPDMYFLIKKKKKVVGYLNFLKLQIESLEAYFVRKTFYLRI